MQLLASGLYGCWERSLDEIGPSSAACASGANSATRLVATGAVFGDEFFRGGVQICCPGTLTDLKVPGIV